MRPYHIKVLAALQSGKPMSIKKIAESAKLSQVEVKNCLRDLLYNGSLAIPMETNYSTVFEVTSWRISALGSRLVKEMKTQFGKTPDISNLGI